MAVFHEGETDLVNRICEYLVKTPGIGGFSEHVLVLKSADCYQVLEGLIYNHHDSLS